MKDPDLFDRLMHLPPFRRLEPFYRRHREVLLYLFFGGLAFLINVGTCILFTDAVGMSVLAANVLSWIITVLFAFLTNRSCVFQAEAGSFSAFLRQMLSFYGGRVFTLVVEEIILYVFIILFRCPDLPVKTAAQIVVIVLNYLISKRLIFR